MGEEKIFFFYCKCGYYFGQGPKGKGIDFGKCPQCGKRIYDPGIDIITKKQKDVYKKIYESKKREYNALRDK